LLWQRLDDCQVRIVELGEIKLAERQMCNESIAVYRYESRPTLTSLR